MSVYYKECFLEQIYHFDALKVWKAIDIGLKVSFRFDDNNFTYGKNIKVVLFDNDSITLGILNEEDSKSMIPFLESKRTDVFIGDICFIDNSDSENKRIKIVIRILSKNDFKKF